MKAEARLFKSLADETRLKILWLLMGQEELCVCDVMRTLGITQSKSSRHLRYLCNVGLVSDRREGVWMNCRLAVPPERPGEIHQAPMRAASSGLRGPDFEIIDPAPAQVVGRQMDHVALP